MTSVMQITMHVCEPHSMSMALVDHGLTFALWNAFKQHSQDWQYVQFVSSNIDIMINFEMCYPKLI